MEQTPVAELLRESGWLYAGVNAAHIFAFALLVGAIAVLDLRLLGLWRDIPVAVLARPLVAMSGVGLLLAMLTGGSLLTVQATEYVANPFLYIKFGAILVGLVNVSVLRLAGDWTDDRFSIRRGVAAVLSLLAWVTALTAGRFIAYW